MLNKNSKLKFLVDESSGRKMHNFLLSIGFETKFVADSMPAAPDIDILRLAEKEDRILITNDKDFGEIIFRLNEPSSGVVLLRLKNDSPENRQKHVSIVINSLSDKLKNNFLIVTEGKIRIKKI